MVGDNIGGAGWCWGLVEFTQAVGASKFFEDGGNGGGVVCVIVCILPADGLEGGAEFAAPIFAGRDVDVGEKDEGKLGVIYSDSVGGHPAGFGMEKFHVGRDFLSEVEFELDDLEELGEDVGGVPAIGALDDGG